jgi:hypothetical protein
MIKTEQCIVARPYPPGIPGASTSVSERPRETHISRPPDRPTAYARAP